MPTFNQIKTSVDTELENLSSLKVSFLSDTEQLKGVNKRIEDTITSGQTPNSTDTNLVTSLTQNITDTHTDINNSNTNIDNHMSDFAELDYKSVMTNLSDDIPIRYFQLGWKPNFTIVEALTKLGLLFRKGR